MGMDEITQSYAENVKKKRFYTVINNSYTVICCSTADKKKKAGSQSWLFSDCLCSECQTQSLALLLLR